MATLTLSPERILILFFLSFPAVTAVITCPFSNLILNIALGRSSSTLPVYSKISSFAKIYFLPILNSTDLACPSKPSKFARVITEGPRVSIPFFDKFIYEILL